MYLSKLILNLKSRKVRSDISNCQNFHRSIMSAFPSTEGSDARHEMGILYRIESNSKTGQYILLVQSQVMPDWSRLSPDYLLDPNPIIKTVDENFSGISEGDIFSFRLRVNPTKKVETSLKSDLKSTGTRKNGRREPLRTTGEKMRWLSRKSQASGFELLTTHSISDNLDLFENNEGYISGEKIKGESCHKMIFSSVLFEGRLRVIDRSLFLEAIKNGIGSGKSYGFGLLSIAKVR